MGERKVGSALVFLCLAAFLACGQSHPPEAQGPSSYAAPSADIQSTPSSSTGPLVVFLGDSLSAGLGLGEEDAYPARVAERLAAKGLPIRLVNAGVSGDTTAGGRARIGWLLQQRPDVLVVELGANDGLRGQPLESVESNLRAIIQRAQASGAQVLLVGMRIPTNYGPDYSERFANLYSRLAREMHVALVPFLLEGVGGHPELNMADGLHPTAEGHKRVAETVLPYLESILRKRNVGR